VHNAAQVIPFIFAKYGDRAPNVETFDAGSHVDVVGYEQRASTGLLDHEALMPAAFVVIGKDTRDASFDELQGVFGRAMVRVPGVGRQESDASG